MQEDIYLQERESKENRIKSLLLSILFHTVLLLILFLVSFKEPQPDPLITPPQPTVTGIEVNLGNSDIGFGDIQPLSPGEPSPEISQETPAQSEESSSEETVSETSENDDPETQVINKQENKNQNQDKNNRSTTQTSSEKKPKTTFGGVTGTGGNNSDDFNDSRNQGIAGGNGDQGNTNGTADSDNYNGNEATEMEGLLFTKEIAQSSNTAPLKATFQKQLFMLKLVLMEMVEEHLLIFQ
jgi:hypothetical protein